MGEYADKLKAQLKKFEASPTEDDQLVQDWVNSLASQLSSTDSSRYGRRSNIQGVLDTMAGYGYTPATGPGGEPPKSPENVEEYLQQTLSPSVSTSKMTPEQIMAAALDDAAQGRRFAYEEFAGAEDRFLGDPLVQQLQGSALGLLQNPDILSEDLQQQMLAGSDAILSRSYQGQQANLAGQIGNLNMDPNDPLARSLAAQGRFGALQSQAQNTMNLRTQAATLNRQGLENAMRLGLGTSGYVQGTLDQYSANRANILSSQPLSQIGPAAAALGVAMDFEPYEGMNAWQNLGLGAGAGLLNSFGSAGGEGLWEMLMGGK